MGSVRFTVVFLRHGQTAHNEKRILQGHHDAPLNENGRKQSYRAGKALSNKSFNRILSSDLSRAYETAEIVKKRGADASWPSIEKITELRERMFGVAEDRPLGEFINSAAKMGEKPEDYTPEGAESLQIFAERIIKCLHDFVFSKAKEDDSILVVSHGGVIREIIKYLMSLEVECSGVKLRVGTSPNTGVTEIIFDVEEKSIKSINTLLLYDKSHLEPEENSQEDIFKDNIR